MLCNPLVCFFALRCAKLSYMNLCCVIFCCVVVCYLNTCYVLLWYALLCYANAIAYMRKCVKTYVFSYIICIPRYSSNSNAEGGLPSRLQIREGQCDFCLKCGGFRVFRVCGFDRGPKAADRNRKA